MTNDSHPGEGAQVARKRGSTSTDFQARLDAELGNVRTMLVEKNAAYGDSALNPVRCFSKADAIEQLKVRIDDKLSRFMRGHEYPGDDTVTDLIGYLLLLRMANRSGSHPGSGAQVVRKHDSTEPASSHSEDS